MIALDIDDHHLHSLRMLAGGHGKSLEEYLQLVIEYHCKHLRNDTDRGLAFGAIHFLGYESIPEMVSGLLHSTILGYEVLSDPDGKDNL